MEKKWHGSLVRNSSLVLFEETAFQTLLLLSLSLSYAAKEQVGWRIGITGPPGAGKSSLVETLGLKLAEEHNLRVGVLCVDPSSSLTGGSVLGDRTRMARLSMREDCFVRGAAAGRDEGGLNGAARHQLLALQGWCDVTLVETVGVGQTEHEVEALVDSMLLLLSPAAGDGLQGMKRGLTELADLVAINKSDGALKDQAARAASDYRSSMRLLGARKIAGWIPPVLRVSAKEGKGLDGLISELKRHREMLGDLRIRRGEKEWNQLWLIATRKLRERIRHDERVNAILPVWKNQVKCGEKTIDLVAEEMLELIGAQNKD